MFKFGAQVGVGSFFAETSGFAGEEDGRVGFVDGEEGREGDDGDGDGEDPEDPAPAGGGGEKTAADGAWEGVGLVGIPRRILDNDDDEVPRMGPKRAPIAQRLMARPLSSGRIRSATVPLHEKSANGTMNQKTLTSSLTLRW